MALGEAQFLMISPTFTKVRSCRDDDTKLIVLWCSIYIRAPLSPSTKHSLHASWLLRAKHSSSCHFHSFLFVLSSSLHVFTIHILFLSRFKLLDLVGCLSKFESLFFFITFDYRKILRKKKSKNNNFFIFLCLIKKNIYIK